MTGYREHSFDPNADQRQGPQTLGEWLSLGAAVLMAIAMLASSLAKRLGVDWYPDLGVAPLGIAEFVLAGTFFARARVNSKAERFSPRQLLQMALLFLILGIATVALALYAHFKGA